MALSLLIASCGGSEEETTDETVEETGPTFEASCTDNNDVSLQIAHYGYQYDSTFTFNGKVDIVRSTWAMTSDSTAELNLYNYEEGAADTTTNFNISATFRTHNGVVIGAGTYPYNASYKDDYALSVTINNSIGKVYFNWFAGMPDQGSVTIKYADNENACGSFALEVNDTTSTTIGHVVLSGNWKTL